MLKQNGTARSMDTSAIARIKAYYSGESELITSTAPVIADRHTVTKVGDPFSCLVLNLYLDLMRSEKDFLTAGVDRDLFKLTLGHYTDLMPIRDKPLSLSTYIERYSAIEEAEAAVIEMMSQVMYGPHCEDYVYLCFTRGARARRVLTVRKIFNSLTVLHPLLQDLFLMVVDVSSHNKGQDGSWGDISTMKLFTSLINTRDNVFLDYSPATLKSYFNEVRATLDREDLRRTIEGDRGVAALALYQAKIEQMMTDIEVEAMLDQSLTAQ